MMVFMPHRAVHDVVILALILTGLTSCGKQPPPVDATPFRPAIQEYLRNGNMAMAVKEIKQGPTLDGNTGQLTASLTHEQLGGPSVTWTFYFERRADGTWTVVRHED